uniref:Uncharacterized protein n=1 Tax=Avena sativa TaxID=4498 RepID=A0ACD5ZG55_AVESA
MRTRQILLIALALAVLSSHHLPATVSAAAEAVTEMSCQSWILNPVAPCDPAKCKKDCQEKINGGVGTCYGKPFHKGCDCEYCPTAAAAASALPRKLAQMN